jgi:hypothetical protein
MSVGVTKDYKLKVRNLHASHTLGWSMNSDEFPLEKEKKKKKCWKRCFDLWQEFHLVHAQRRVPRFLPVLLFHWRFLLRSVLTGSSSCREQ